MEINYEWKHSWIFPLSILWPAFSWKWRKRRKGKVVYRRKIRNALSFYLRWLLCHTRSKRRGEVMRYLLTACLGLVILLLCIFVLGYSGQDEEWKMTVEIDERKEIEDLKSYLANQVWLAKLPDLLKCFEVSTAGRKSLNRKSAKNKF